MHALLTSDLGNAEGLLCFKINVDFGFASAKYLLLFSLNLDDHCSL